MNIICQFGFGSHIFRIIRLVFVTSIQLGAIESSSSNKDRMSCVYGSAVPWALMGRLGKSREGWVLRVLVLGTALKGPRWTGRWP